LALLVQTELKLDPHSGVTVVFRSKRGDRLKILVWDGTGMVLIYKVLEQGSFAWVKTGSEGINPSSGRIEGMNAQSAGGSRRDDTAVAGAVRDVVRRVGLAAGDGAAGRFAYCGGMI
jgi:transposase